MEEHIIFLTELVGKFKDFDHKKKFNLLIKTGCGRRETLHSNLIVDFLNFNPKYLELFLKEIDVTGFNDYPNTKIYRELPSNGFIDIYILNQNLNKAIIIENKVDDPGKSGQLQKYYDEIEKKYPNNVTAFYLTKYGNLPPKDADCKRDCLSYEKHIVGWLDECIKYTTEPSDHRIKESLEIYVELVRDVINRDKYMEKVFDYLKENENKMSMAIDIYRTLNGRNFFQDKKIREEIKEMFEDYLNKNAFIFDDWEILEDGGLNLAIFGRDRSNPIGDFYFYPTEIYAEFPERTPNTKELVPGSHIVGNNLSDDRLKAILTNNTDVIHEYFDNCVSQMREKINNYHGV